MFRASHAGFASVLLCLALSAAAAWATQPASRPASQPAADPWAAVEQDVTQGALRMVAADGQLVECPLKHTDVKAEISGFLARVHVSQTFHNPAAEKIEAVYVFPLPHGSAVDEMTMVVGDRRIVGVIRRRAEAREMYEAALAAGQTAALLEQERPNIFTQSVANIPPGGEVRIEIAYVDVLEYDQGEYEFHFPMVVGPRYIPGSPLSATPPEPAELAGKVGRLTGPDAPAAGPEPRGTGWSPDTSRVPDASRITPPVLAPGFRNGHDVSLSLTLDAGVPVAELTSTSHQVELTRPGPSRAEVRLADADSIPNRSFVLRYKVAGERPQTAVLAHRPAGEAGYLLLMVQPAVDRKLAEAPPREMVFLVDVSGSMNGEPIAKVREAMAAMLKLCRRQDTLQVILFFNSAVKLFDAPVPAEAKNIERALAFTRQMESGGGTEMLEGVRLALAAPPDPKRVRIVVMLTDGYIGNEAEIIAEVGRRAGDRLRFWCIGIGGEPNRLLVDGVAKQGGGMGKVLGLHDDSPKLAGEVMDRIQRAQLDDVRIDWGGAKIYQTYPSRIPALWVGQPITLFGRYDAAGPVQVAVEGRVEGEQVRWPLTVDLPAAQPAHEAMAKVWARQRIANLMQLSYYDDDPEVVAAVTEIALKYRLMSQYTSFVAVDEKAAGQPEPAPRKPRRMLVPVPIPEGTRFEGFFADGLAGAAGQWFAPAPPVPAGPPFGPPAPNPAEIRRLMVEGLMKEAAELLAQKHPAEAAAKFTEILNLDAANAAAKQQLAAAKTAAGYGPDDLLPKYAQQRQLQRVAVVDELVDTMKAAASLQDAAEFDRSSEKIAEAMLILDEGRTLFSEAERKTMLARVQAGEASTQQSRRMYDRWIAWQQSITLQQERLGPRPAALASAAFSGIASAPAGSDVASRLLAVAQQYRRQRRYDMAAQVAGQVRRLDPSNTKAADMAYDIEELASDMRYIRIQPEMRRQERRVVVDSFQSAIPWYSTLIYPKNWAEITARREPYVVDQPANSPADVQVQKRLEAVVPLVSFSKTKLEDAIQFFRDVTKASIHVKWRALEEVGIKKDTPVDTKLKDVTVETALRILLDDVSGAAAMADRFNYEIRDGALIISTNADLQRETWVMTYDIRDLVLPSERPQIPGRRREPASRPEPAATGDDDDDDSSPTPHAFQEDLTKVVQDIIDTVTRTVDPDSWGEAGSVGGSIKHVSGILIVSQTARNHEQIRTLLRRLRSSGLSRTTIDAAARLLQDETAAPGTLDDAAELLMQVYLRDTAAVNGGLGNGAAAEEAASLLGPLHEKAVAGWTRRQPALGARLDLVLRDTPLPDALQQIARAAGLEIMLLPASEADAASMNGGQPCRVIYLDLRQATAAEALDAVCAPFRIGWWLADGRVAAGTARRRAGRRAWVYDVARLAYPTEAELKEAAKDPAAAKGLRESGEQFCPQLATALGCDLQALRPFDGSRILVIADAAAHERVGGLLARLADPAAKVPAELAALHKLTAARAAELRPRLERARAEERAAGALEQIDACSWRLLAAAAEGRLDVEAFTRLQVAAREPGLAGAIERHDAGAILARAEWAVRRAAAALPEEPLLAGRQWHMPTASNADAAPAARLAGRDAFYEMLYEALTFRADAERFGPLRDALRSDAAKKLVTAEEWTVAAALLAEPADVDQDALRHAILAHPSQPELAVPAALACRRAGGAAWRTFRAECGEWLGALPLPPPVVLLIRALDQPAPPLLAAG